MKRKYIRGNSDTAGCFFATLVVAVLSILIFALVQDERDLAKHYPERKATRCVHKATLPEDHEFCVYLYEVLFEIHETMDAETRECVLSAKKQEELTKCRTKHRMIQKMEKGIKPSGKEETDSMRLYVDSEKYKEFVAQREENKILSTSSANNKCVGNETELAKMIKEGTSLCHKDAKDLKTEIRKLENKVEGGNANLEEQLKKEIKNAQ